MLDIEVILVVENGYLFLAGGSIAIGLLVLVEGAIRRDGNGREVNGLGSCGGGHDVCC